MKAMLFLLFCIIPMHSLAGAYKCVMDGNITYSQRPCEEGASTKTVDIPEHTPLTPRQMNSASIQDQHRKAGVDRYIKKRKARRALENAERDYKKLSASCSKDLQRFTNLADREVSASRAAYYQTRANEVRIACQARLEISAKAVGKAKKVFSRY